MTSTPHTSQDHQPEPAPTSIEVVRGEEQLQVGRTVRVSDRAVLRKYVVTETVTKTFEVRHEEVRLDLEPATDDDALPTAEAPFSEDHVVEVVLHREEPFVQMHVTATERIRLHVDTVTEHVPVSADVREERIDLEAAGD